MSDQQSRPQREYPAEAVGKVIDQFLAKDKRGKRRKQP